MSTMMFSMPVSASDLEGQKETQSVKEELIEQKDALSVEEKITEPKETESVEKSTGQKETESVDESTVQKETESVDESTKPKETESAKGITQRAPGIISFSKMLTSSPNETITVKCVDDANNILQENITLKVGKISDNAQQTFTKNGKTYRYKEAKGIKTNNFSAYVNFLYIAKYNGKTYYGNNTVSASLLENDEEIVLVYEEVKEQINVNYEVYVNNQRKTNYSGFIDIPHVTNGTIKSNKNESFVFTIDEKEGYKLNTVKYNNKTISPTNGTYITDTLTGNTTIRIDLNEIRKPKLVLDGYNVKYNYSGIEWPSTNASDMKVTTFTSSSPVQFKINALDQDSGGESRVLTTLNLAFKYNGVTVKESQLNVPTFGYEKRTYNLGDGLYVDLTANAYVKQNGLQFQPYDIKIRSDNNRIYDDIYVYSKYKSTEKEETNVTSENGVRNVKGFRVENNHTYPMSSKTGQGITEHGANKAYKIYFDMIPGYAPGSVYVRTFRSNVDDNIFYQVKDSDNATMGERMFEFSTKYDNDIRFNISAGLTTYKVQYSEGNITDNNQYYIKGNTSVKISTKQPYQKNKKFVGWKVDGVYNSKTYKPGDIISINEWLNYGTWDSAKKVKTIKLVPQYIDLGDAVQVAYYLDIKSNDGKFNTKIEGATTYNRSVKVFKEELDKKIKELYPNINLDHYFLDESLYSNMLVDQDQKVFSITYNLSDKQFNVGTMQDLLYTGASEIKDPVVTDAETGTVLTKDVDYTVQHSNQAIDAGKVDVTVIGLGKYSSCTKTVSYNIVAKPINHQDISVDVIPNLTYNGNDQKQSLTVRDSVGNKVLQEGKDYDLVYNGSTTNAGTVTINIKGKGNYSNQRQGSYEILKAYQEAPTGLKGVKPTTYNGTDGKIQGVDNTMEYRKEGETDFKPITGTEIENLGPGKYEVRKKGDANNEPSPTTKVEVPNADLIETAVPTANQGLKYDGTEKTGVDENPAYTLTGHKETAAGNYQATATLNPGYVWADGTSDPKTIDWTIAKGDQSAPTGLTPVKPTTYNGTDGKIQGVDNTMEYRKEGETDFKPITGTEIENLGPGKYEVRKKGDANNEPSPTTKVEVPNADLIETAVPTANQGLKYDGTEKTGVDENPAYTLTGHKETAAGNYQATATLNPGYVWADGTSDPKTIDWTIAKGAQEAPGNLTPVPPTKFNGTDGKIQGVTPDMEYRKEGETDFTPITGTEIANLGPGKYEVRKKGDANFAPSDIVTVIVPNAELIKAIIPTASQDANNPKTGDNNYVSLWLGLLLTSGGAAAVMSAYGIKRRNKKKNN